MIQTNKSATLATNNDQYLFQPVVIGLDAYNQTLTGDKSKCLNSAATDSDHIPCTVYSVENHPADSRVDIDENGTVQTLTSRMGTGGGNVPMVMEEKTVYCLQGNGIDRADTAGCNGKGWNDKSCYTLNTIDRPAVAYQEPIALDRASFNQGKNALYDPQFYEDGTNPTIVAKGPNAVCYWDGTQKSGTLTARNAGGSQRMPDKDNFNCVIQSTTHGAAYGFDPGASRDVGVLFIEECAKTLTNGTCPGHHDGVVIAEANMSQYIVRRLTPTECARLQGFPDTWGHIDHKDDFTDEEYEFWLNVRNTHAEINGKAVKNYNKKQMLTWYNKLHTDSAEYKLWGNGIALPCALYVMEGIADVMKGEN